MVSSLVITSKLMVWICLWFILWMYQTFYTLCKMWPIILLVLMSLKSITFFSCWMQIPICKDRTFTFFHWNDRRLAGNRIPWLGWNAMIGRLMMSDIHRLISNIRRQVIKRWSVKISRIDIWSVWGSCSIYIFWFWWTWGTTSPWFQSVHR